MDQKLDTTLRKNKKEKGAALMMALFFFTMATFIVTQLSQETLTEAILASREMKKLKSKYAAKAGLEMALLRIKAYQFAKTSVGNLGSNAPNMDQQLSMLWQFPLPWPLPIPADAGIILNDEGEKVLKKSLISNLTFNHEIQDTGQKIDLNSLGSPVKRISDKTIEALLKSFEQIIENNEDFADEHSIDSVKEVLNNVADWIDDDEESRNGGSEDAFYPYEDQRGYPRNSSFMTMSELMLVDKMDDLIFEQIKNLVTIHGTFGVNVNTAEKDILMGLDPQFTEETTKKFLTRRAEIQKDTDLDKSSFDGLLSELGFNEIDKIHTNGIPILYSPISSFRVIATGVRGQIETTMTAYVIDANALKEIFIEELDKQNTKPDPNPDPNKPQQKKAATTKKTEPPKGKPYIVHLEVN